MDTFPISYELSSYVPYTHTTDDFVHFIKGCYANKKYDECVYFYNHSEVVQSYNGKSQVALLGAKAMYIFHKEELRLRKGRALMSPKLLS